ncbi:MAG: SDR family NAD(P)-dependent oxidoreductase [Myxococcota bacterium]|nr:SDR family NAD(P)-dependent oxidoreductase [Myxococcota bacterium]
MPKTIQCPPELLELDLSGKTVLITGGYGGIGLVIAKQLQSQNAHVILAGRNSEKGQSVADKNGMRFMQVDLSDMDSVRAFGASVNDQVEQIDVLFCNAAVMATPAPDTSPASARTKEGWEIQMATNYLGHALLVHLLTDKLKATPGARVISMSSCCADSMPKGGQKNQADIDFEDPHWNNRPYHHFDAYGQSKLAQILHARELAKRFENDDVTVVSLHPGWGSGSDLDRHMPYIMRTVVVPLLGGLMGAMSLNDAAQVPLFCALSPNLQSGKFYSQVGIYGNKAMQQGGLPMEFVSPNATPEKQEALWNWTQSELGLS